MAGRPAMTLLHLGPGCANGIANLHNARRAHTPVLNIIGDHATWHRQADPPLAMDIPALAGTVSRWCRASTSADGLARDTCRLVGRRWCARGAHAGSCPRTTSAGKPVLNQADAVAALTPITIDARAIEEAARPLNGPGR